MTAYAYGSKSEGSMIHHGRNGAIETFDFRNDEKDETTIKYHDNEDNASATLLNYILVLLPAFVPDVDIMQMGFACFGIVFSTQSQVKLSTSISWFRAG